MVCVVVLASSSFASCTGVSAAMPIPVKKISDRQLVRMKLFIINMVIGQSGEYIEGDTCKMQYKIYGIIVENDWVLFGYQTR